MLSSARSGLRAACSRVPSSRSPACSSSHGPQALEVRGPALGVADRVELEPVLGDPEPAEERVVQLDDLGVAGRVVGADRLDVELPVLAKPALLRSAVAVDRLDRVQLLRLRLAVQAVLEVRPDDRRRRLRAQRQRAVAAVEERVHLLRDDVRPLARRAGEQLGVLEHRRVDPAIAVQRAQPLELPLDQLPGRLLGREDVVRAARSLELHARSSARNGFRESSAPRVVGGPWPE